MKCNNLKILSVLFLGIAARYAVMLVGYNFDFESYCIVGKIVSSAGNVYAETARYNYGPIFSWVQGLLYYISSYGADHIFAYRILIVGFLTVIDGLIAWWVYRKFSPVLATVFFLNPISIIITGYHNQFDNFAILLMLLATLFYNTDERFSLRDLAFVALTALSLSTKHIFFMVPFWLLLRSDIPFRKRIIYSTIPVVLFLLLFVPYVMQSSKATNGVLENVFLYRSLANYPLLYPIVKVLHLPSIACTGIFLSLLAACGFIFRRVEFKLAVLLYSICLVTFTSAMANQYLAIPMVALSILCGSCAGLRKLGFCYAILTTAFLSVHWYGLDLYRKAGYALNDTGIHSQILHAVGYSIPTVILLWLLYSIVSRKVTSIDAL